MKSYQPASSKSWSNSATVNSRKETDKSKEITDYINSLKKGSRIVASRLIELSGNDKKMYSILKVLSGQNMVECRRTGCGFSRWFKKRDLTEREVKEASAYII